MAIISVDSEILFEILFGFQVSTKGLKMAISAVMIERSPRIRYTGVFM
jgi:hypothetical protein